MLITSLSYSGTLTTNLFIINKSTRKKCILACKAIIQTCSLKVKQYNYFFFILQEISLCSEYQCIKKQYGHYESTTFTIMFYAWDNF